MSIVNNFEIEIDFFEVNPHLKLPFKEFTESWDKPKKSKNTASTPDSKSGDSKPTLSQVMWAITLYMDYDSPYFNYPKEDRLETALEQSGLSKKYELSKSALDIYDKLQDDSERRYFRTWCDKMDEADKLLRETTMTLNNMDDLMSSMSKFDKLLIMKDKVIDRINKKKKDNVRGDKELGGLEAGLFD